MSERKKYLTGIKPTGMPHLGNYYGAIRPALEFSQQTRGDFFYFIADYHSLTAQKDPEKNRQSVYEVAATWLACGLDPSQVTFYRQSDVPEIFELNWILACHTPKGDLNRAHAYKALTQENKERAADEDQGVNAGLFTYPVLMAADILLFDTDFVPVGKDQIQHVEMARSMAQRINQHYRSELLVEPQEVLTARGGAYIPGLDGRKMSKSYDNTIGLFLPEKKLQKMINKIVTDSTPPEEPKKTEDSVLFELFAATANDLEVQEMKQRYEKGISWGEVKVELFRVINREITPYRERFYELMEKTEIIDEHLALGAQKARKIAQQKILLLRQSLLG